MITLQRTVATLSLAFAVIVLIANEGCAPKYFQRGDVVALLGLAVFFSAALFWAASSDDDVRRVVGSTTSAAVGALFVSTVSFPLLAAPLAVAGCLRLPRTRSLRLVLIVAIPLVAILTVGLEVLGQSLVTPDQFRCP